MIKVTCAIIIKNGRILVTQRKANSSHPLNWEFPGGKLNSGETLEYCIIREIKEELDIEIEIKTNDFSESQLRKFKTNRIDPVFM
ncbi:MAG: NUDIX domain-containing protein [Draconibacterium sp.]|nr:NUDIX domain-containing protein [Draconibacterium sp.]